MQLQNQLQRDWNGYFYNQPSGEVDSNHHLFHELNCSSVQMDGNSDPYCSIRMDNETPKAKSCSSRSFIMDARIRLDSLMSGRSSPVSCCATSGTMYNYDYSTDSWDIGLMEEQFALDLVELLDLEDDVQDEESWLYESPKKHVFVERSESAVSWCRHVLDKRSPEMEAACRQLMNRLDSRTSCHYYRRPAVFHQSRNTSVDSCIDKTSVNTTSSSNSFDFHDLSMSSDSTSYRLDDLTDVHIMARLQEASLRQDSPVLPRSPDSRLALPSYFNTTVINTGVDDTSPGNQTRPSSSPCWWSGRSSLNSSPCSSPTLKPRQSCQSPKLARLHQQVTQFKLLKLTQGQGPGRTGSPLKTSLRSLQAVRNSRSLDADDCSFTNQITPPPSGVSCVRTGSSSRPWSHSAAHMNSGRLLDSVRDISVRSAAVKRLQRSQSVSPCRIPNPSKGHFSAQGRVFASPERSTRLAWVRNTTYSQR
ncbi:SLAIN motif-containing protein-like isoform X1 [Sphaeramia orbicularis]|uniref:SLAIN motif-containing protein-like isoform X1 n=1 Tax=Sphaeramia orbicularis TaxID=375764 RepID=UPI00117CEDF8|nr:SLAIN motif-containing protein-like isoform X1 [Sphaeramia orbicularis]